MHIALCSLTSDQMKSNDLYNIKAEPGGSGFPGELNHPMANAPVGSGYRSFNHLILRNSRPVPPWAVGHTIE